jgi:hypothetical protein
MNRIEELASKARMLKQADVYDELRPAVGVVVNHGVSKNAFKRFIVSKLWRESRNRRV